MKPSFIILILNFSNFTYAMINIYKNAVIYKEYEVTLFESLFK